MGHFFRPESHELKEEKEIQTGRWESEANFQASYNSDRRLVLRWYETEEDGSKKDEQYVVLDKNEARTLKDLIEEVTSE